MIFLINLQQLLSGNNVIYNELTSVLGDLFAFLPQIRGVPCTEQIILGLPKADIHVHLPGTVSPATAWELGLRNGLLWWDGEWRSAPMSPQNPHRYYSDIFFHFDCVRHMREPDLSLLEYAIQERDFASFDRVMATVQGHRFPPGGIQNEQDLMVVFKAYLQLCLQENILYTEVQQNIRIAYAVYPDLPLREARLRLFALFHRAAELFASHGVTLKFLNCFNKTLVAGLQQSTQERSIEAAQWLDEVDIIFPNLFVGLQSAGSEACAGADPDALKKGYQHAYERGFGCEAHAGEGIGFQYLQKTLNALLLQRIAHGFQAIENLPTIHEIQDRGVTLVMAPVINLALGAHLHRYSRGEKIGKTLIQHIDDHPFFPLFRKHQLKIALSSDNPQMGGISLCKTMMLLSGLPADHRWSYARLAPLTLEELIRLNIQTVVSSFASVETKVRLLKAIYGYLIQVLGRPLRMSSEPDSQAYSR